MQTGVLGSETCSIKDMRRYLHHLVLRESVFLEEHEIAKTTIMDAMDRSSRDCGMRLMAQGAWILLKIEQAQLAPWRNLLLTSWPFHCSFQYFAQIVANGGLVLSPIGVDTGL